MAIRQALPSLLETTFTDAALVASTLFLVYLVLRSLYRLSPLHTLHHIPGPICSRLSSIPLLYHSYMGDETAWFNRLHRLHGPMIRISPNTVDISDGAALHDIYVANGGFRKPDIYHNFSPDGHHLALFSETDPAKRQSRVRAVAGCFASSSVRAGIGRTLEVATEMAEVLQLAKEKAVVSGKPVDVLGLARSFAADAASVNLLKYEWGALARCKEMIESGEMDHGLRGEGMLDFYDAFGRYWYLPPAAFKIVEWMRLRFADKAVFQTIDTLWTHIDRAVAAVKMEMEKFTGTFPERLLHVRFSEAETKAQIADALFAGVETTGFNVASIVWHLVRRPAAYSRLREEVFAHDPSQDVRMLPYLGAVVYEGLRISKANPTRFPRVVPAGGWAFGTNVLPAGTEVSCTPYELHFNSDIYNDPTSFLPERWLDAGEEMRRNWIPFGLGSRRCIARELALMEIHYAVYALVKSDALAGAFCCQRELELLEWFSVKVVGGRIDLKWNQVMHKENV
ncbi:uncharacterized protein HMPREF1541_10737 [Cyphellophora europaea CBS 101466]|uniref:Cytochrome P450 n=1 Tax=Cyphellophora europaea (strain CBS 101466) TaxID=1220924 RepID=W2S658_CYPE1|nr:uncharacterized protein HMPREF1541_10737 [Cyphellophora europaea CBS 101466]ETN44187.1 hypothetical protein HMPREF1541_10737 [Cyphellophora europaea CBS 101466]